MTPSKRQFPELRRLLAALDEGELTERQEARIEQLVAEDVEARRFYLEFVFLLGQLRWDRVQQKALEASLSNKSAATSPAAATSPLLGFLTDGLRQGMDMLGRTTTVSLLAAAMVLGSLLTLLALWAAPTYRNWIDRSPSAPEPTLVARLVGAADCRWADPHAAPSIGTALFSGEKIEMLSGLAEIKFNSGARVILEGPVVFQCESRKSGFLHGGRLTAKVSGEARGFMIGTPAATVVDLGTEFGVEVNEDRMVSVHVFQGKVMLQMFGLTAAASRKIELNAGQWASVDRVGAATYYPGLGPKVAGNQIDFVREIPNRTTKVPVGVANPAYSMNGLVYHLDAALGVTTSAGLVTRWADQSGNNNHFVGTDSGTQPTWVSSVTGFNNLPAVRFDGSDVNPLKLNAPTTPRTVFIVNMTGGSAVAGAGIWGTGPDTGLRRRNAAGAPYWQNRNGNDFHHDGDLYVNGATGGDPDGNHQPLETPGIVEAYGYKGVLASTSLGGYYTLGGRNWAGDIAEIAVFDRKLTQAERELIVGYLGAKYGIRTPFPPPPPPAEPSAPPGQKRDSEGGEKESRHD